MRKTLALFLALACCFATFGALAEEAPTVLTIGSSYTMNENWVNWPVFTKIQEDLNIKIDFTQYDDETINLVLAGGELPDIVLAKSQSVAAILNNRLALDVAPLLEEYAPNLLRDEYITTANLLRKLMGGKEEALYLFAPAVGLENADGGSWGSRGYIVRWDYYQELGCPEIKNDDDYIAVIKQMQANHPTTESGKRTYGVGVESNLGDFGGYRASFTKAMGLSPWTFGGYKYANDFRTNDLYDGYTDLEHSTYWTDMAFYNKLYREGLFDEDCFTMTYDEYAAKMEDGTYMGLYFFDDSLYNAMRVKDPDTMAGYVAVPSEGAMSFANKVKVTGNLPSAYGFINAKTENWQTALAFYNALYDPDNARIYFCGIQGESWDYDENGVPYLFEETLQASREGKLEWKAPLTALMPYTDTGRHTDGYYYDLFQMDEYVHDSLNPFRKAVSDYYGVACVPRAQQKLVEEGRTFDSSYDCGQAISAGIGNLPLDIKRILDTCNDIFYRAMPKLVMAQSYEEFQKVQADVLKQIEEADEATAWEWVSEAYAASRAIVEPIFMEARETLLK